MQHHLTHARAAAWSHGQEIAWGYLYWLAFLLVLEPGNIVRAMNDGRTINWDAEAVRILGASFLGATSSPVILALIRRFPIEGSRLWRHATVHSLGAVAMAVALIAASCLLAVWLQVGDTRAFWISLPHQLAANGLLIVFSLAGFTAIAHAARFARDRRSAAIAAPVAASLQRIEVKSRGRLTLIEVTEVDWIETQGNYLALHVGTSTHLIRETAVAFERKLDPRQFVRIHRRALVALDRIREIAPLANGDATARLANGSELKISRNFREKLRAALDQRATPSRKE